MQVQNLLGSSLTELEGHMLALKEAKFRAKQLYGWIYGKGVSDFGQMLNISKPLREKLEGHFSLSRPQITQDHIASDGTRKWLLKYADGSEAETVFIPEQNRGTLCISSQVGCSLTCGFCHTGTQKLVRNLEAGEIVGQLMIARDMLKDWYKKAPEHDANDNDNDDDEGEQDRTIKQSNPSRRSITNIVMMGMGEPLYNTDNVIKAMQLFTDGDGLGLTKRRVTLSTSGVAPEIGRVGAETGVALAISLHAVHDELRSKLVPINRKYKLAALMQAIRDYPTLSNAKRVTFEYIMLEKVNDSLFDAKGLCHLIAGIPAKINLIPFNPWPGSAFLPSSPERIDGFAACLRKAGHTVTVRKVRGQDILAACGQLKSESLRLSKKEQQALDKIRLEKEQEIGLNV